MKKLITIFLSSVICIGLWGQQTVPMTITGDVYIATGGVMTSQGTVHLKADALPAKVAKVSNVGTLKMDTVIFYSNPSTDGLLMNQNSAAGAVTANVVAVRKTFTASNSWHTMSFPFDIDMGNHSNSPAGSSSADVRYSLNGKPLVRGTHFETRFYNAQDRADNGLLVDGTGNQISYWRVLASSENQLNKATGYQFAVKFSVVDTNYPTSGATSPMEIDFLTSNPTQVANLLDKKAKGINLTYAENSGGPYASYDVAEGWNAVGGLNSTLFVLRASPQAPPTTVNFSRAYNYWDGTASKWNQYNPKDPSTTYEATLSPYAVFFVQSNKSELNYATGGGILYSDNGLILTPAAVNFRASQEEESEDMVKLRLVSANSSSVISPPTYFCFKNGYNEAYNNKEDDVYLSSQTKELGLWSLARSQSGGLWTALFTDCLPLGEHEVNLGFCAPQAGEYIFSLNECYNETILSAVLWDKIENRTTDLLTQNYRFQTEAIGGSDSEDRFVLFFNKTFTAIDELQTSEIYAYADNNVLTVKNLLSGDNLQIVDVAGRTIASGVASGSEFFVTLNQKGVYIVNVKGKKTLKVLNK